MKVAKKTGALLIGRQEAETEVFTDMIVSKTGNLDKALLYVLEHLKIESKIQVLVNSLIHRGANISAANESLKTPLHFAVERGLKGQRFNDLSKPFPIKPMKPIPLIGIERYNLCTGVAGKLLENDALPHSRDKEGRLALETALKLENDELAALLLAYIPNRVVRCLFLADRSKSAEFSLHKLIRSEKMQKTVLSVLDCMIEPQGSADSITVYYGALEADEAGRPPDHPQFQHTDKSCMLNLVYHDTVRLLIRRKWKSYARKRFELNAAVYMFSPFCLTFAAVTSVMAPDPTHYHGTLHVARAVFEVVLLVMATFTLFTELIQIKTHRLEYFHDVFNCFDSSASILILVAVPLRFSENVAQWHVLAFGYIIWTLRIFKFAAVFRQSGAYAQILSRILAYDFMQFGLVFLVILLAFSVSFYLETPALTTFWGILFVGVRSLTEAAPVVEYTGDNGYGTVSVILMLCFLFTYIVILLNILIAQLTDTYQKVQQDAQRGLEANRAWIVSRVELNSIVLGIIHASSAWVQYVWYGFNLNIFSTKCLKCCYGYFNRKAYYKESEEIKNLQSVLDKWKSPPLNEMSKYVRDVWDSLDSHRLSLLTIQQRLARQENTLRDIQEQLRCLLLVNASRTGVKRPRFYRSDTEDGHNPAAPTEVGRESGRAGKEQTTTPSITIPEDKIDNLIRHKKSVLDCMIEPQGSADSITVYHGVLEADEAGRPPDHPHVQHTKFCMLNLVYQDTVRLLIRRKWKSYARKRFECVSAVYTFCALAKRGSLNVLAVLPDFRCVDVSDGPGRTPHATMVHCTWYEPCSRHRLEYFHDVFNCFDSSSSILILVTVPLRFSENVAQWHVLAFGYIIWTLRIFKFAAVFR
ncbi:TRPV4-like protein [Mya arenaria]|uniref:TRPV4-like protein n=1 Tax=Mya arenaria TaxID=6604 RepID=A0ABY7EUX1_MYAAR|nr:TRPV4-like protein [Mya arenaria]